MGLTALAKMLENAANLEKVISEERNAGLVAGNKID
jgi:hypothetical protein